MFFSFVYSIEMFNSLYDFSRHIVYSKLSFSFPVKYDDNIPTSKKFRIELLIPLVILVICFVVLLGVIIYQRRLIQNKNTQLQRYREERVGTSFTKSICSLALNYHKNSLTLNKQTNKQTNTMVQ
jgi:hypothetical protein